MVKNRNHSEELVKAFSTIRFFLMIIGQMPFDLRKKKDETYSFKLTYKGLYLYLFLFFFILNSTAYLLVTSGIVSFVLSDIFKEHIHPTKKIIAKNPLTLENEPQLWERYYTRREMVPVLVVWSWMTIAFAGSLYVILFGKFYVHYMNYFNRVVQMIDMDMTPGIQHYLWKHNIFSGIIIASLILGFCLQPFGFHAVGNTSNVIANFLLRNFGIEMVLLSEPKAKLCQLGGFVIMLYALVGSRANILQFLFFSQLLKNGAKIWNERFTKALEIDEAEIIEDDNDQFSRRLELRHVLKDHLILVQLFQMTESAFSTTLLTYYCFQIISVVMELYQLAALGGFTPGNHHDHDDHHKGATDVDLGDANNEAEMDPYEVDQQKGLDTMSTAIVCILLLCQNVWFAISATVDASGAYEQAMEGFQILRQHGFMYCRNKHDRNFVLSMYISFSKSSPMQLTAGGYFAINKALLVSMAGTIVNWAVSIYQTKVDQWK